jgi:hypothetical protein
MYLLRTLSDDHATLWKFFSAPDYPMCETLNSLGALESKVRGDHQSTQKCETPGTALWAGVRTLDAGEAIMLAVPDMRLSLSVKHLHKVAWSPDNFPSRSKAKGRGVHRGRDEIVFSALAWPT